jgi:hypothetical protein
MGCRLTGEHWQYLFARVRKDVRQLHALATVPDYQIVLRQHGLF